MNSSREREDLRVRRTHKLLWDALMAELTQRSFEEITVTDICERAMVHRTTFYKHYEDKHALLEQGMRRMYAELVTRWHEPASAPMKGAPPLHFVRLFEHVAEHQAFYRAMLCGEGVGRFQQLVKGYILELAEKRMRDVVPGGHDQVAPPAMHVQFFVGGVLSLITWWLENDMPVSPQQMAHYVQSRHGGSPPFEALSR